MSNKYRDLASNTAIFAIGNILVKLISFFLMPLYTSVLTTSQYGVAELLNNSIEIVLPVATLCIVEALYRFSIDKDADHKALLVNSVFILVIGDLLVGAVSLLWYYAFAYEYALYFWLLYVTTSFYKMTIQFARGLGHVKRYVVYGVINSLVLVAANIIMLVVFDGGIAAYLFSFSISYGVSGIVAFIVSKEYLFLRFKSRSLTKLKEMLRYSLPSIPNMLSWWVNNLSDRYIVLGFWGASAAGLYTAASKLPAMVNMITTIFQKAWQYSTATEIDSEDNEQFFSNVFRLYSYLCVAACAVLILLNKFICRIVLQSDFYVAWSFVPILLFAATLGCIGTYFGTFYNAIKNNKMLMVSTLIGALCNIVMNFIFIPRFGGLGAAAATAASYFIIMVIRIVDIRKKITININFKRFILQYSLLFVSVICGCFAGAVSVVVPGLCAALIVVTDYTLLKKSRHYLKKIKNRF